MRNIVEHIKNEYSQILEGMLVSCGILVPCPVKIKAENDDANEQ